MAVRERPTDKTVNDAVKALRSAKSPGFYTPAEWRALETCLRALEEWGYGR